MTPTISSPASWTASIAWSGEKILIKANTEERANAILDVFQSKLIKRGISLKSLDAGEPFASGKEYRIEATLKEGIDHATYNALGSRNGGEVISDASY